MSCPVAAACIIARITPDSGRQTDRQAGRQTDRQAGSRLAEE